MRTHSHDAHTHAKMKRQYESQPFIYMYIPNKGGGVPRAVPGLGGGSGGHRPRRELARAGGRMITFFVCVELFMLCV